MVKYAANTIEKHLASATGTEASSGWQISPAIRYVLALAMTAFATILAVGVESRIAIPNISLIFVLPVVIAGIGLGTGPSLFAAVLGALSFNFFLIEPRYSLMVDEPGNIWAIALLFTVGLIVSTVTFTYDRRNAEATELTNRAETLRRFSNEIIGCSEMKTISSRTAQALTELFGAPATVALVKGSEMSFTIISDGTELTADELDGVRSCANTAVPLHGGTYPYESSRFDLWPARIGPTAVAVLGVAVDPNDRPTLLNAYIDVIRSLFIAATRSAKGY